MDVKNIVKNNKQIYISESSLKILMDFERVLDHLDLYVFNNWKKGELVDGPNKTKHWVTCTFMWPEKFMPDPDGGLRLTEHNIKVFFKQDVLNTPVKIEKYDDFRPGTKKPRLKEDPVWLVIIKIPAEMIEDISQGFIELEGEQVDMADINNAYSNQQLQLQGQPEFSSDLGDEFNV